MGFTKYDQIKGNRKLSYSNPIVLWVPGAVFFSLLAKLRIPPAIVWILNFVVASFLLKRYIVNKDRDLKVIVPLSLMAAILLYIGGTNLIFFFRPKDMRGIQPLVSGLFGVSITIVSRNIWALVQSRIPTYLRRFEKFGNTDD
jgi:branched-subunit amino acid transport protein